MNNSLTTFDNHTVCPLWDTQNYLRFFVRSPKSSSAWLGSTRMRTVVPFENIFNNSLNNWLWQFSLEKSLKKRVAILAFNFIQRETHAYRPYYSGASYSSTGYSASKVHFDIGSAAIKVKSGESSLWMYVEKRIVVTGWRPLTTLQAMELYTWRDINHSPYV